MATLQLILSIAIVLETILGVVIVITMTTLGWGAICAVLDVVLKGGEIR